MIRAAVAGASGYAGGELLRLLLDHPRVQVVQVTSERLAGKEATSVHPHLRGRTRLRFQPREALEPVDALFLALRHGESSAGIGRYLGLAPLLIDLSADFRLRSPQAYPRWYGWEHPRPDLLPEFTYGLAEARREEIRRRRYLAAGGCLATATILGLRPLAEAGLLDRSMPLVAEAKTGSSAAGSAAGAAGHHPHRSGEIRSFAPTGHRHTAEIVQELGLDDGPEVAFSATAVEAVRGVLVTAHAYLRERLSDRDVWGIYRDAYAREPFVRIVKSARGLHRYPNPKVLAGTNHCDVGFETDPHSRRVVVMSAIDNLVKGSAGQAVQALNVHHGWEETLGLTFAGLYPL